MSTYLTFPPHDGTGRLLIHDLVDSMPHASVVGESTEWKGVLKKATQVAATDTTVLLTGESGTGKEVIARFIHRGSGRRNGPFVALNCAALPEPLLESELFGYERGAFTSAERSKPGYFELAAGGVLFLDEVSELSLCAQAKFLRALQEREFLRLGGTRSVRTNVRLISGTNVNLRDAVAGGRFRSDLYYRLNVFDIYIPPLRQRRGDIVPLATSFLREFANATGRPRAALTLDATEALVGHDWPGNVRELRNVLERASIICEDGMICVGDLSLLPTPATSNSTNLDLIERCAIERVMRDVNGNKAEASRQLGISRTQLYSRLRKYGLTPQKNWQA